MKLDKLDPRSIFLLTLVACAAVILAWYYLRFQPRQAEITQLQSEVQNAQTQADLYRSANAQLPALRTRVADLRVEQSQFLRALPSAAQFGTVLDEVRRNVSAAGATLNTFNVQTGTGTDLPSGVRPISLTVGIDGQFTQVFQALRSIETMNRFATVNTVGLQLPQADSLNPNLVGNLGVTVYTFDPTQATPGTSGATPAAPSAAPSTTAPAGDTSGGVR